MPVSKDLSGPNPAFEGSEHAQPSNLFRERRVAPARSDGKPRLAHQHIFTVLRTWLLKRPPSSQKHVRIIDIGCGDGQMMLSLQRLAARQLPDWTVEIYGFDIGEQGFNEHSQMANALMVLENDCPDVDWSSRISMFSANATWNYPDGFFDAAISNTVMEHIEDLSHLLGQLRRVLKPDGVSIHLFPLSHCMYEGHINVPLAHWIIDFNNRVTWIALMNRMGIGRYRQDRKVLTHASLQEHAVESSKYVERWTFYRSFRDIAAVAKRQGLAISYDYSKNLLAARLRRQLRIGPAKAYRRWRLFGSEWISFMGLRYIAAATVLMWPADYDIGRRIAAEKRERMRASPVD